MMQTISFAIAIMKLKIFHTICLLPLALSATLVSAAEVMAVAGRSSEIKTFVNALKNSSLAQTLEENGPFTIFAPSNSAFDKLSQADRESLFNDKGRLDQVLAYHVIPGKTVVAEVKPGQTKTLDGSRVSLKSDNGKITINNGNVTLSDLEAENGVIHIIDTVLLPQKSE